MARVSRPPPRVWCECCARADLIQTQNASRGPRPCHSTPVYYTVANRRKAVRLTIPTRRSSCASRRKPATATVVPDDDATILEMRLRAPIRWWKPWSSKTPTHTLAAERLATDNHNNTQSSATAQNAARRECTCSALVLEVHHYRVAAHAGVRGWQSVSSILIRSGVSLKATACEHSAKTVSYHRDHL